MEELELEVSDVSAVSSDSAIDAVPKSEPEDLVCSVLLSPASSHCCSCSRCPFSIARSRQQRISFQETQRISFSKNASCSKELNYRSILKQNTKFSFENRRGLCISFPCNFSSVYLVMKQCAVAGSQGCLDVHLHVYNNIAKLINIWPASRGVSYKFCNCAKNFTATRPDQNSARVWVDRRTGAS